MKVMNDDAPSDQKLDGAGRQTGNVIRWFGHSEIRRERRSTRQHMATDDMKTPRIADCCGKMVFARIL